MTAFWNSHGLEVDSTSCKEAAVRRRRKEKYNRPSGMEPQNASGRFKTPHTFGEPGYGLIMTDVTYKRIVKRQGYRQFAGIQRLGEAISGAWREKIGMSPCMGRSNMPASGPASFTPPLPKLLEL